MVTWERFPDSAAHDWDQALLAADDHNVFQSHGWGEYKRRTGWLPERYLAKNASGSTMAMTQILTKAAPLGTTIGWAAGGPVLRFPGFAKSDVAGLAAALVKAVCDGHRKVFLRLQSHLPNHPDLAYGLSHVFAKPLARLNAGYTIHVDLARSDDEIAKAMTSKHRYYIKQSLAKDIRWVTEKSDQAIDDLVRLNNEVAKLKQVGWIATSRREVAGLCETLGENALIMNGYLGESVAASCLVLQFGKRAFYMIAASSKEGRDVSASYAMISKLISILKTRGVTCFDFGGIDPITPAARGVNHFKQGFGGQVVDYLGEWEWATGRAQRWLGSLAIAVRRRAL